MPATLCRSAFASLVLLGSASPAVWAQDEILVPNFSNGAVVAHGRTTTGDAIPLRALFGSATRLHFPAHAVLDPAHDELFVANIGTPKTITVYARTASGNLAPLRTLSGPAATLIEPIALALALVHDEVFVANDVGDFVAVYARTASGDTAPRRTLTGPATGLSSPVGLLVDLAHDELVVANRETVTVYPRAAIDQRGGTDRVTRLAHLPVGPGPATAGGPPDSRGSPRARA
jgi:DNA-binding beta-propeller fold protein YncE